MTKVLVVDDHDLVRMGISRMLADVDGIEVIGEASSGEEALDFCRQTEVDVILMDVKMPGMGGLEATRKLLHRWPQMKVIAVSALDDDLFPGRMLKAGAWGYLTKGTQLKEMIVAIRTVVAGKMHITRDVAVKLAVRNMGGKLANASPFDKLSERELQAAVMIVNGMKVAEIANTMSVSSKTVNSYRYRIFAKLDIQSDVELALLAVKHQLLDPEAAL
ncbi:response regulator [Microbulbifer sp. 2201CG32-9]|uniref:response regulator n=1 Tax=unclassified Microbulbifer TaxID=2619833 RepID=UPI00345BD20C